MDVSLKENGQHPVWKAAALTGEDKNKSPNLAKFHTVNPCAWGLSQWLMAWPCG